MVGERLIGLFSQAPLAALPILAGNIGTHPRDARQIKVANQTIHLLLNFQLIAAGLIGLTIIGLAPHFVSLMGGVTYQLAIPSVRAVSVTVLVWSAVASLHPIFLARERPIGIFYLNLIYVLSTLGLYWILTPKWQATGTAFADGIGQLFALGLGLWLVRKWYKFEALRGMGNFLKIAVPILILGLPFYFLQPDFPLAILYLAISVGLYITYILRCDYMDSSVWASLEALDWQPAVLNLIKNWGLHSLRKYQLIIQSAIKFQ